MNIFIRTMGCPKNTYDSEYAAGLLENAGHVITDDILCADAVIINTCAFINDAKVESIDAVFEAYREKKDDAFLVMMGCLSQRYADDIFNDMPEVDVFIGVNELDRLPSIIEDHRRWKREKYIKDAPAEFVEYGCRRLKENPYSAVVKIAEGCDNACTYCIIPAIRGGYRSRKKEDILSEVSFLAENGCKELILIAQDVAAYGLDIYGSLELPDLLRKICRTEGIRWVRIMYCYEEKITDELIDVISEEDKICNYIDIPLQHASDRILSLMNRQSTYHSICDTIERLRDKIPDIHIRTTLITGFPGEEESDFDRLYEFVEETRFERLGIFSYSCEEGTAAGCMPGQIPDDVKDERRDSIMRLQMGISLEKNQEKTGTVLEVLVEDREEQDGEISYIGRTLYDAPEIDNSVIFTSHRRDLSPGDIVNVLINDAFDYDLIGTEV